MEYNVSSFRPFYISICLKTGFNMCFKWPIKDPCKPTDVISLLWHDTYTSPITLRTWASYGMHFAIVLHYSWFIQHLKQKDPKTCENHIIQPCSGQNLNGTHAYYNFA